MLKKIKIVREHNFEGGANNGELDIKDTDRGNWSSKVKYLSLALPLNILFLLLVFIGFNNGKVRFGIAYIVTIIVQTMVNVGLFFAWSCMCLVEDMINTLDDCDLLEKVVNMTNVHEHNDVTVSIKVQQFRSRYAKYVYYNCTRVLCECHGNKRDREPSRIPVKMLKRLSQKSRKLRSYVRRRLSKNVRRSSKVHHLIKNIATQKNSTHKTSCRFVQKMRRKPMFSGTRNVKSSMRYKNASRHKHGKKYLKYLRFFSCNFPYSEYKGVIHRGNCTKYKLHNDIEKNPGPVMHHLDPGKTIKAP